MKEIRIIIAGGRDFDDYILLCERLDTYIGYIDIGPKDYVEIISGCVQGADKLGERYALDNCHFIKRYPADWERYGKSAGPIRNREMAEYAAEKNGVLFAFWDGKSKGTKNMIETAEKFGLETHVVIY